MPGSVRAGYIQGKHSPLWKWALIEIMFDQKAIHITVLKTYTLFNNFETG